MLQTSPRHKEYDKLLGDMMYPDEGAIALIQRVFMLQEF